MNKLETRFLSSNDIPALMALECEKWDAGQAASSAMLLARMQAHPELCIGVFCPLTGRALASLFMRPVCPAMFTARTNWAASSGLHKEDTPLEPTRSLFGISLSSNNAEAVREIFKFFYPRALKTGWHDIYLGSPIPGFRKALRKRPNLQVWKYSHAKRQSGSDEPLDPQLRYYFKRGFKHIISVQDDYFPHAESLNHGVILRGVIPLSGPRMLWRAMPLVILQSLSAILFRLVR